jgi:hypothetical protein
MRRVPSAAASSPRPSWHSPHRLPLLGPLLLRSRAVAAISATAVVLVALGTMAITVGATPEPIQPRWLGRINDGVRVSEERAAQLLRATTTALASELREVEVRHGDSVSALNAELIRLRDAQVDHIRRQAGLESRLAAAIALAAVEGGASDLAEEVQLLRLVPAALLLQAGVDSGQPFAPALQQFAAVVATVDTAYLRAGPPVKEQIASLQPYADNGVVSWRDLRRSFASLPHLIERADPSSWWDQGLVMGGWRADPLEPLHEAQAALMVDDLEGAIAALGALQGEAALVAEGWLAMARARLDADAMVNALYRVALAAGAGLPGPGPTLASSSGVEPASRRPLEPAPWGAAQATTSAGSMPQ